MKVNEVLNRVIKETNVLAPREIPDGGNARSARGLLVHLSTSVR
jgi:hypothetical protein